MTWTEIIFTSTAPRVTNDTELLTELNLSRIHRRVMTGLLTGHCHLTGHLFKLGLVDISECARRKHASGKASLRDAGGTETGVPGPSRLETRCPPTSPSAMLGR